MTIETLARQQAVALPALTPLTCFDSLQASDVDLDGYRQSKARQSGSPRSPRSTKDFSAARAALNDALSGAPTASQDRLFGFPAHPNRFSLLAQSGSSRTRSTTACEETTVADSTNTLTEATPKAESRGKAAKFS